jgi:Rrf2 family iron-sulfur cluster assembly transcriptional regulator
MFSQTGQYAINAAIFLAGQPRGSYRLAREIGRELGIPGQYLSKVLHLMAQRDLLESQRGRQGGFRLKVSPDCLSLFAVLDAVEETRRFRRCLLGPGLCSKKNPCPLHQQWVEIRGRYLDLLKSTTISTLVDASRDK